MKRVLVAVAIMGCGGTPMGTDQSDGADGSDGSDTVDGTDSADGSDGADGADDGPTPDAPPDAPAGATLLAPRWQRRFDGTGYWHDIARAGSGVAVLSGRATVGGFNTPLTIASGEAGEVTMTSPFQSSILWFNAEDGKTAAGRALWERTTSMVGGMSRTELASDHHGGLMVAGDFVGEVRFHPGSTAARLEQAIVESTSPEFVDASDPVLTGYDAVGAPRGFVRGTTTGTLSRTRTNYLLGRAVLADGDWVVSGYADSSSFKFAGETVGADGYVARVSATGQLKWLRRHAGFVGYSELVSTASGNLYARSFVEGDGTLFVDSPTPYVVTAPPEHEHGDVSVVSRLTPEGAIAWNRMYRCTTGCYQSLTPLADGGVLIKLGGGGHAGTYDLTDPAGGVLASGAIDPNRSVLIQLAPDGTLARATEFDVNIASIVELDDGRLVGVINAWTDFLPAALASVPVPPGLGEDGRLAALLVLAPDHTQQQLAVIGTNLTPELAAIPGGVVVASDVYMQTDIHLVDATGNFSHQPACAVDECLHVLAYVTDETVGVH